MNHFIQLIRKKFQYFTIICVPLFTNKHSDRPRQQRSKTSQIYITEKECEPMNRTLKIDYSISLSNVGYFNVTIFLLMRSYKVSFVEHSLQSLILQLKLQLFSNIYLRTFNLRNNISRSNVYGDSLLKNILICLYLFAQTISEPKTISTFRQELIFDHVNPFKDKNSHVGIFTDHSKFLRELDYRRMRSTFMFPVKVFSWENRPISTIKRNVFIPTYQLISLLCFTTLQLRKRRFIYVHYLFTLYLFNQDKD